MSLTRASCQTRNTLRGHYEELAATDHERAAASGQMMLELLSLLEDALQERSVWGLTSHYHLMLLASDDSASSSLVSIAPPSDGRFVIDYLMPKSKAPWSNARVVGEAQGVQAAADMILRAMKECQAWSPE